MTGRAIVAPRIETERLVLRGFQLADFDGFCAMISDPEVTAHMGGVADDRSAAWERFVRIPGFWVLLGYGLWLVEEKASGRMAGALGFGMFERVIDPPLSDIPEGAWVFDKWAHGKGFASEALTAAFEWTDANLPNRGYCCMIHPDNEPSLALAKKFGFEEARRAQFKGDETVVLERPAN